MRPGREADHSPPASAGVKKTWIYTALYKYPNMNMKYATTDLPRHFQFIIYKHPTM
jgi:hypothetical protein